MTRLSDEIRYSIIAYWKQGMSERSIATTLEIHRSIVQRWIKRYRTTGTVSVGHGGRSPVLSDEAAARVVQLLVDEGSNADKAAQQLYNEGLAPRRVHKTTIIRAARREEPGIKLAQGPPAKQLTAKNKAQRMAFAEANKARLSWDSVMFTDRKRFTFKYPGQRVKLQRWVKEGTKHEAYTVSHPKSVNIYAGVTRFGVTKPHIVTGTSHHKSDFINKKGNKAKNITAGEYAHVLQQTLFPEGLRLFDSKGVTNWVFQQDNDPCHKQAATLLMKWSKTQGCNPTLLQKWPPHSPDLNLIENMWAYCQRRVDERGCKTFQEFQQAVLEEVQNVPLSVLRGLFDSMPNRIALVIEKEGDKTGY